MTEAESRARNSPLPPPDAGADAPAWIKLVVRGVAVCGSVWLITIITIALAWARPVALAVDAYVLLGMLRQAGTALPPQHRLRRTARSAWSELDDSSGLADEPTASQRCVRHRLQRLCAATAIMASGAMLAASVLP